jgi:hypothetical protein
MKFEPTTVVQGGDGIMYNPTRIPTTPAVAKFFGSLASQKEIQNQLGSANTREAAATLAWQSTYERDLRGCQIVVTPAFRRGEQALLDLAAKTKSELPGWARVHVLESGDVVVTNAYPPDLTKTLICTAVMNPERAAEMLEIVGGFVTERHAWVAGVVCVYQATNSQLPVQEVKERAFAAFNRGAWSPDDQILGSIPNARPVPPAIGGALIRLSGIDLRQFLARDTFSVVNQAANAGPIPHQNLHQACLEQPWQVFSHPTLVGTFPGFEESVRAATGDPDAQLVHLHVHPFTPITPTLAAAVDRRGGAFNAHFIRQCVSEFDTPETLAADLAELRRNREVTIARLAAAEEVMAILRVRKRPTVEQMKPLMVGIQEDAVGQLEFLATCSLSHWTPLPVEYRDQYTSPEEALIGETFLLVNQIYQFDRANLPRIDMGIEAAGRLLALDRTAIAPDELLIQYSTYGRVGTFTESPMDVDATAPYPLKDATGNSLPIAVEIISNPFGRVIGVNYSDRPEGEVFAQTPALRHRSQYYDYRTGHQVGGFELTCRFDHDQPTFHPPGRLSETGVFPNCVARAITGEGYAVLLPENSFDEQGRVAFQALAAGTSPYNVTIQSFNGQRVVVFPLNTIDISGRCDSFVQAIRELGFETDPICRFLQKIEFWARVWAPGGDYNANLDDVVRAYARL